MIEVSQSWCIVPIDNEIVPFDNAMMDILIAVLAAQLGTPRGRYDEHSDKFSLCMKPRFN
jgi:hypothetical protein